MDVEKDQKDALFRWRFFAKRAQLFAIGAVKAR